MDRNQLPDPAADVAERLNSQVAEGRRLLALDINNQKELQKASATRSTWVMKNVALLKDCPVPNLQRNRLLTQVGFDNTDTGGDFQTELQLFREATNSQIGALEDVLSQLPPPREKQREVATSQPTSFKAKLEAHPIGVAGILCGACITIVIGVMTWFHGENEKTMITKYDIIIEGMKNKCDAERRASDAAITKLKDDLAKASSSRKK